MARKRETMQLICDKCGLVAMPKGKTQRGHNIYPVNCVECGGDNVPTMVKVPSPSVDTHFSREVF